MKRSIEREKLYELTKRTQQMIGKMHLIAAGKKPLPEMEEFPNLLSSQKVLNDYYITAKKVFE